MRPGCHSSAGQYRLESGVSTSSPRTITSCATVAAQAGAELELGVGQDDAALAGDPLGAGVDREGQLPQPVRPARRRCRSTTASKETFSSWSPRAALWPA